MDDDIAIKVTNLNKSFKLPHDRHQSLKSSFISKVASKTKKGYEIQRVLQDVNFEVKKGDFFGIVGRNGSGKSTLLKCLANIYTPESGSVSIDGSLTPFIELGVGFNPELTGRENVYLNGALMGFSRQEMTEMYQEIVEFAELDQFMDQKLKNYSSGMQVRLAFSIAIQAKSDILLLDEVLAVGDSAFQRKCFDYFDDLRENNKTVILVSHSMDSIKRYCTNGILIEDSKIVPTQDIDEVIDKYLEILAPRIRKSQSKAREKKNVSKPSINIVYIKNRNNHIAEVLRSGDPASIEIDIKVPDGFKDFCNVGVGLWAQATNLCVFSYNTKWDDHNIDLSKSISKISLKLDKLPLINGEYYINVSCFGDNEATMYDMSTHIKTFTVRSTREQDARYRGVLNIPHEWNNYDEKN